MHAVHPAQTHHFQPEVARMTIAVFPPHIRTEKEYVNKGVGTKVILPEAEKKYGFTWDETVEVVGA